METRFSTGGLQSEGNKLCFNCFYYENQFADLLENICRYISTHLLVYVHSFFLHLGCVSTAYHGRLLLGHIIVANSYNQKELL